MSDVVRMQQEAEARVRAMRERSRQLVGRIPQEAACETPTPPQGGLLDGVDGDRLLLLLLAVLLIRGSAPPELIVALLYIAL